MRSHRILLTTFGSLGDLHPYLALGLELQRRGHRPVVGSVEMHRPHVEAAGLEFSLIRTAVIDKPDRDLMRQVLDMKHGAEFLVRRLVMPALRDAFADTMAAAQGASLLVSHPLTFATRMTAEMMGTPWVSTQLAPIGFLSAYDPPVVPVARFLERLHPLGPGFFRPLFGVGKRTVRSWTEPYRLLREELGLTVNADPFFQGSHSPLLVLALFSRLLGQRQPDWPAHSVVTGFPLFDGGEDKKLSPQMQGFLDDGEAPIVFTLGTSAVMDPGRFYEDSALAAGLLNRRAILLTGSDPASVPARLPGGVAAFDYAPFSLLFPRASAIVHQGGVGTTAQAMRAGKPMIVMPYAVDQPDNGARVRRLGIARTIERSQYSAKRAASELGEILSSEAFASRARIVGEEVAGERGAEAACDELELVLSAE